NALKLVRIWGQRLDKSGTAVSLSDPGTFAMEWFDSRFSEASADIRKLFAEFKISEALKSLYSLIWDDFCSWYLEWVKPGFEQTIEAEVYHKTIWFFEELLQMLHPFMPFITEEIYHLLYEREDDLCVKPWPKTEQADEHVLAA